MNRERIAGKCKQLRGVLRESWGKFIDDRRCVDEGRREQLAGRAQDLYGINKEKLQRELNEFLYRNRRWDIPSR